MLCGRLVVVGLIFLALQSHIAGQNLATAVQTNDTASRINAGPSFNREIRPLLAKKCFACHGPDAEAREADLRLDRFVDATTDRGDNTAIRPGDPSKSELIRRIASHDPDVVMPPAKAGPPLTEKEVQLLNDWIQSGANYEAHWAFVPPQVRPSPKLSGKHPQPARDSIDAWVYQKLDERNLTSSPESDRVSLIRRVALDLTGLPPSETDVQRFLEDARPDAYERMVDRLLASQTYGERWTRQWLDLARYSDTNGYEKDRPRSVWPYRDWVLRMLNADQPFDQFSIEQIAGDMLPGATEDQRVATGFHRNTMLNEEGGIDPLEYRFYATIDRLATTGTIWLGMTVGCAQCHTHKFDPLTHEEFYRMMALLNNADEPELNLKSTEAFAQQQSIETQIVAQTAKLKEQFPPAEGEAPEAERRESNYQMAFTNWLKDQRDKVAVWHTLSPTSLTSNLPKLETQSDGSIFSSGDITKRDLMTLEFSLDELRLDGESITALRLEALTDDRLPSNGPGRCYYEGRRGEFYLSEWKATLADQPITFESASVDLGKLSKVEGQPEGACLFDGDGSSGWSNGGVEGKPCEVVIKLKEPMKASGKLSVQLLFERHFAASLGRFRISATTRKDAPVASSLPTSIEVLLTKGHEQLSPAELQQLELHYLSIAPELAEARKPIDELRKRSPTLPLTLVMLERPADNPRSTHRHHRGEYLSPREDVQPGMPAALVTEGQPVPRNRLELAQWLVSQRNPLVGRVTVNRVWQAFFGQGIVSSPGDLGTQAPAPTHPELLDVLAVDFMRQGWSQKLLHRRIVLSSTYRQQAMVSPDLQQIDPGNEWLTRGPRLRLDAEMVRDQALSAAGLLVYRIGGPSVRPPQPSSVTELAYGNDSWQASQGADRYRRSVYTFSKRTAPFAAYLTFDAPSGELCTARRDRSNTPLQALTLLNDELFLEPTRALAKQVVAVSDDAAERSKYLLRRVLVREPDADEIATLNGFVDAQLERINRQELDSAKIHPEAASNPALAAWTLAARLVMNLDETLTR